MRTESLFLSPGESVGTGIGSRCFFRKQKGGAIITVEPVNADVLDREVLLAAAGGPATMTIRGGARKLVSPTEIGLGIKHVGGHHGLQLVAVHFNDCQLRRRRELS